MRVWVLLLLVFMHVVTNRLTARPPIYHVWENLMFLRPNDTFSFRDVKPLKKDEWLRAYTDYFDYPRDITGTQYGYCDHDDNGIIEAEEIECF